jgi:hypothetical protein
VVLVGVVVVAAAGCGVVAASVVVGAGVTGAAGA